MSAMGLREISCKSISVSHVLEAAPFHHLFLGWIFLFGKLTERVQISLTTVPNGSNNPPVICTEKLARPNLAAPGQGC
ncbi:hypothetical protein BH11PSE11_BH11PSE11_13350 [soil metagenome]